jgi:glycosyltransferase involved in cell wall biosynthesis
MKILHVPYGYYPDPVGGTEVYVHGLARQLVAEGLDNVIAAPAQGNASYRHDGLPVRRFAVRETGVRLEELYGLGDAGAAEEFGRILDTERPRVVHLHAFTMGVSVRLMREAKRRGCRVVFSYHTPTVSCVQGALMLGRQCVCEGRLNQARCSQCFAKRWGLIPGLVAGHVPGLIGRLLGGFGLQGGIWTALRCRQLVGFRHAAVRHLFGEVHRIIAPCRWARELLLRNAVPTGKIVLCRQGVVSQAIDPKGGKGEVPESLDECEVAGTKVLLSPARSSRGGERGGAGRMVSESRLRWREAGCGLSRIRPLRAVFLGRMDPTKGLHQLIEMFQQTPGLAATLDIYGVAQDAAGVVYEERLRAAAAEDRRMRFRSPIQQDQVTELLAGYDVLLVPSEVMETGPLVVLEAFAAGRPVVGSNLGGIAELVRDGVDGLLVWPGDVEGWRAALERCVGEVGLLDRLRRGIRPPRTMVDVAREVQEVYKSVL